MEEAASASIYLQIANVIRPASINMKEDIPSNPNRGAIPILDTEMWISNGNIILSHYLKPMPSMEVILHRSAMTMASKINILVQEGAHRVGNCYLNVPWSQVEGYLNKLMISMKWSGNLEKEQERYISHIT